jgi:hypothetical protein
MFGALNHQIRPPVKSRAAITGSNRSLFSVTSSMKNHPKWKGTRVYFYLFPEYCTSFANRLMLPRMKYNRGINI